MNEIALHELSAADAARLIRDGSLKPSDLMEATLNQIDRLEGSVHAFCYIDREAARREAAELTQEAADGRFRGILHGIPFAAKDMIETAGMPTEAGSSILRGWIPEADAEVVRQMKNAGAILVGKTHTTEFANIDPGPTANPWNLAHTPGGSSSGSAAAVAARMVPISLGTQTGGSTLRPAAYCGVLGLKPSLGRVSLRGVIPLSWCMDHIGIFARSVSDLALTLQVTASADPLDASCSREAVGEYVSTAAERQPPRFGIVTSYFNDKASPDAVRVTEAAVAKLVEAGASVAKVNLPESFRYIHAAQEIAEYTEIAQAHEERFAVHATQYRPSMRETIEVGYLVPAMVYVRAHRVRRRFRTDMIALLRDFDAILMPTARSSAPKGLSAVGDWDFQSPWSSSGLPSLSLPCGFSADGLPLGLQFVSGPFAEDRLLAAAAWAERIAGMCLVPPTA
jgi:aspartyl-tRNA(Asn)/glutamyl-tRNA(Gln) amidotransferase subunit A